MTESLLWGDGVRWRERRQHRREDGHKNGGQNEKHRNVITNHNYLLSFTAHYAEQRERTLCLYSSTDFLYVKSIC